MFFFAKNFCKTAFALYEGIFWFESCVKIPGFVFRFILFAGTGYGSWFSEYGSESRLVTLTIVNF